MSLVDDMYRTFRTTRGHKRVYLVFAMKRSGHHAIVNWICRQDGSVCHRNNAYRGWERGAIEGRKVRSYGRFPVNLLANFEDFDFSDWFDYRIDGFHDIRKARRVWRIIVLRDFRNWLASCMARKTETREIDRDVYENLCIPHRNERGDWKEPRLALYEKQLNEAGSTGSGLTTIKFDQWTLSKEYRRSVAESLGLSFSDAGAEEVVDFGGGSSFDHVGYDGNAADMKVHTRWKTDLNDEEFFRVLNTNLHLEELSENLFNGSQLSMASRAPERLLLGFRPASRNDIQMLLRLLEDLRSTHPEIDLCYDITRVPRELLREVEKLATGSGLNLSYVEEPTESEFKYVTGLLKTKDEACVLEKIEARVRLRTGLQFRA